MLLTFYTIPGDTTELSDVVGAVTADATVTRKAAHSLRIESDGASSNYAALGRPEADWIEYNYSGRQEDEFNVCGWIRGGTMPANGDVLFEIKDNTDKSIAQIRYGSPGHLALYRNTGSSMVWVAGTTTDMGTAAWFYFDCKILKVSGATWSYNFRIATDGGPLLSECSGTASLGDVLIDAAYVGNKNRESSDPWAVNIEGLALWYGEDVPKGPCYAIYAPAAAAGFYTAWTGDYTDVDEAGAHDGDTTKLVRSVAGVTAAETVTHAGASALGIESGEFVRAVKPMLWAKKNSGTSVGLRYRATMYIDGGTTNFDTASNEDPGLTFVTRGRIYEGTPADASRWSDATLGADEFKNLNGFQAGLRLAAVSSATAHCTKIGVGILVQEIVSIPMAVGHIDSTGPASSVVPGPVTVNMAVGSLTGVGPSASAVPGAVSLNMGSAVLAASGPSLTVEPGPVSVFLGEAVAAAGAAALAVVPGPVEIALQAALVSVGADALIVTATSASIVILMAAGVATATAGQIGVVPGPVVIQLAPGVLQVLADAIRELGGTLSLPNGRRVIVAAENRVAAVGAEDRITPIEAEDRVVSVEADDRMAVVPTEDRITAVPGMGV